MSIEKNAVCLYLSTNTDQQIDHLANEMNIARSSVVSIAIANMFKDKDALIAAVKDIAEISSKQEKEVSENKREVYNILDHIADVMEMKLHVIDFTNNQYAEHEVKVYNLLLQRAKHGMDLIKKGSPNK